MEKNKHNYILKKTQKHVNVIDFFYNPDVASILIPKRYIW